MRVEKDFLAVISNPGDSFGRAKREPLASDDLDDFDEDSSRSPSDGQAPEYRTAERVLRLLHLLTTSEYTRQEIFERMPDYYRTEDISNPKSAAVRMFQRDLSFLEGRMKYQVKKRKVSGITQYSLEPGTSPISPLPFNQTEVDVLALLYTLFADPTKHAQGNATQPLPSQSPRHHFAEEILAFIERLTAMLPPGQRKYFDRWAQKPFIYFNMNTVTDYHPHREIIDEVVRAISKHQQIQFEYFSPHRRQKGPIKHEHVDPYYINHLDGHFYLIGYSRLTGKFFEFRIDRIKSGSLEILHDTIDVERRQRPIEFRYWAYGSLAESELSLRWLTQTVEREEVYLDRGEQKRRVLVRATAYSDWRIIQQLHKYADKVELVEPPQLREWMRRELEWALNHYQKPKI